MNIIKSYIVTNAAASSSGGGSGTVTSVGGFSPLFTTSNPTTTPTFTAVNQNANLVYAGPATGAAAAPTFRALVINDLSSSIRTSNLLLQTNAASSFTISDSDSSLGFSVSDTAMSLQFGSVIIQGDDTTLTINDGRGTPLGLQYSASYGSSFTARSLIDKGYADTTYAPISSTIGGTIASTQVAFGSAANTIAGSANFTWDNTLNRLIFRATDYIDFQTDYNKFIGSAIGNQTLTGDGNVGYGNNMMTLLNTGSYNVGIGYFPAQALTTGQSNTFINHGAGAQTSTGSFNTGIGFHANYVNPLGAHNHAIGAYTLDQNTTGDGNIDIGGMGAGNTNNYTSGNRSVKIGWNISFPSISGVDGQLNIQNAIFGTGNVANTTSTSTGQLGVYVRVPTAKWHIGAGSAAASTAPLKFTVGVVNTAPESGAVETDAANDLWYTNLAGTRIQLNTAAGWALTGNSNITTPTITGIPTFIGNIVAQTNGLVITQVANSGVVIENSTASTVGVQVQISPALRFVSHAWVTGPAADRPVDFRMYVIPAAGTSNPTQTLNFATQINGGGYTTQLQLSDSGVLTVGSVNGTVNILGAGAALTVQNITLANNNVRMVFTIPVGAITEGLRIGSAATPPATFDGVQYIPAAYTYASTTGHTYNMFNVLQGINTTGTYTGTIVGYNFNPTLTSVTGATVLAFRAQKGSVLFGGTTITASALLDLQSTSQAFIPPRMTEAQRDAIGTPSAGMIVYNSDEVALSLYTSAWETVLAGLAGAAAPATNAIGIIADYYGTSATRSLNTPDTWISIKGSNGNTYKIPGYS